MFGLLPPSPPLTESLETKISTEFHQPFASQAVAGIALTEFRQPLASQAVAGITLCATGDMTYPALFLIMFGPLPPSPPLTESLETKISTEFHQPLAFYAVAGIAQITKNQDQYRVPSATCIPSCRKDGAPALFLIMFGLLPPSPPLTESLETKISTEFQSLETKISTEFRQPLASQAVAGIALCATGDMTYPALFLIMFGPLPPSPPFTESLETKISTEFHQPLASYAIAGIAQCATCDVSCPALFLIMFGLLPPSPPLTESLETKISTEFHQPLASYAVAGIAHMSCTIFNHVWSPTCLTESLETKISTEFRQPLAFQAVARMAQCATCHMTYPALFLIMFGALPPSPPHRITRNQDQYRVPSATCIPSCRRHCTSALFLIMFGLLPPSPPLTESLEAKIKSLETKISTEFRQPLASQAVAGIALCATGDMTYPALFLIMFGPLPPSPPLTESLETKISTEFRQPLASKQSQALRCQGPGASGALGELEKVQG
ncbi:hypothetical protein F5877DRAFT_73268, partial [Lentinula edodes]